MLMYMPLSAHQPQRVSTGLTLLSGGLTVCVWEGGCLLTPAVCVIASSDRECYNS